MEGGGPGGGEGGGGMGGAFRHLGTYVACVRMICQSAGASSDWTLAYTICSTYICVGMHQPPCSRIVCLYYLVTLCS